MKTRAFIIKKDEIIAEVKTELKNGTLVHFTREDLTCRTIDANREFDLVNAKCGKISRAKKWFKIADNDPGDIDGAYRVNEKADGAPEFLWY